MPLIPTQKYKPAAENLLLTKSGRYTIDDQNNIWDEKTGGQLDEETAFGQLGLNTQFLPKRGANLPDNPNDPRKYLADVEQQDPITKFNFAILDMLSKAQSAGGNVELFKQQRALQRKAIERTSAPTPEELRVLSPGQQSAIRSGSVEALTPELDAVASEIKARDSRLSNFERILNDVRQIGGDIAKNIAPPKEVLDGYKFMIRAGADPTSVPSEIRNKVMGGMTPDDWSAWQESRKKEVDGAGGLTPGQINTTINSIRGAFDNEAIVKEYNTMAGQVNFVRSAGKTPTDDISRIYAFAKMMDPTSAVKEGEYDTIQKYSTALLQRYGLNARRVFDNSGFLTDEARKFLLNTMERRFAVSQSQYKQVAEEYQRQIDDVKAGRPQTITDYTVPDNSSQVVVKHPSGEVYTFPNKVAADSFKREVEEQSQQSIQWQ